MNDQTEPDPFYSDDAPGLEPPEPEPELEASSDETDTEALDESAGDGTEAASSEAAAGTAESDGADALNLSKLQEVGRKAREARASAPPPTPAAEQPDLSKLAEQISGATEARQAIEALKGGNLSAAAKLAGVDVATLIEQETTRQLKGEGVASNEEKLKAALERIAQLEDGVSKGDGPPGWYQKEQQARAEKQAQEAYFAHVADKEAFPILGNVAQQTAFAYGTEAQAILRDNNLPLTAENTARVAEQIAAERLGGLLAQNKGATGTAESGHESKAAGNAQPANTGTQTGGALDNRTASTTAAAMPELDDEEGWEQVLVSLARG